MPKPRLRSVPTFTQAMSCRDVTTEIIPGPVVKRPHWNSSVLALMCHKVLDLPKSVPALCLSTDTALLKSSSRAYVHRSQNRSNLAPQDSHFKNQFYLETAISRFMSISTALLQTNTTL